MPEDVGRLMGVKELYLQGMDKAISGFQEFQMENEIESFLLLEEADDIFLSVSNTIYEIRTELTK